MSDSPLALGIDFGGTSVKLGICQGPEVLEKAEPIPTANYSTVDLLIEALSERITSLRKDHPRLEAVGIGVPGFVDSEKGYVHNLTNVPGWHNVPLKHLLENRTQLPVQVENDANAMAYAEFRHGAAQGMKNVVCLTLGTGVGGGLIVNGELFRGSTFGAGEIGQMSIDFDGKPGNYGNLGALEKYMGNQQIEEHARAQYARVGEVADDAQCTPRHIAEAAEEGDDIARQIWGDVGLWLGSALTSISWIFNPDAFVIGGGVAQAGSLLFDPLENHMRSMLNPVFWEHMKILRAQFGNEAGMIGCATLALEQQQASA
ncbi:MAG: ROK family protein [Verrucomicrobiota bacterium]